jgi:hypothetical protein
MVARAEQPYVPSPTLGFLGIPGTTNAHLVNRAYGRREKTTVPMYGNVHSAVVSGAERCVTPNGTPSDFT